MLHYYNNSNIIFLHATHVRVSEEAAEMSFWFQPTQADPVDMIGNGPIFYFFIAENLLQY